MTNLHPFAIDMSEFNDSSLLATSGEALPLCSLTWSGSPIIDGRIVRADYGDLLVLTKDGTLHGVDFAARTFKSLCTIDLPPIPPDGEAPKYRAYRLHAPLEGRYAAIVIDRGREGVVVEVPGGRVTMRLDGGDYYENTVPFSACFVRHEGRDVLIHRTNWNRLDASDPVTGKLLTERDEPVFEDGKSVEDYHLDYFHGELLPSPNGSRLLDDGWVWHPVSIPRAWSVTDWLSSNAWESENGASAINLTMREDWGSAACWIGEQHVALWGLATWDDEIYEDSEGAMDGPGVRILDVTTTERSPNSRWPMAGADDRVVEIFSDGSRLYVAAISGTTVWDIASRTQALALPGFAGRLHDPTRGMIFAIESDRISALQLPWSGVTY
jgi:hypothetical protein